MTKARSSLTAKRQAVSRYCHPGFGLFPRAIRLSKCVRKCDGERILPFGVHALACVGRARRLKPEHQTVYSYLLSQGEGAGVFFPSWRCWPLAGWRRERTGRSSAGHQLMAMSRRRATTNSSVCRFTGAKRTISNGKRRFRIAAGPPQS